MIGSKKYKSIDIKTLDDHQLLEMMINWGQLIEKTWPHDYPFWQKNFIQMKKRAFFANLDNLNNEASAEEFTRLLISLEALLGRGVKDQEIIILKKDREAIEREKVPVVVLLDNLRSAQNVGSIFRTSEAIGVRQLVLCGHTPTPDHSMVQKTSLKAHEHVTWKQRENISDAILDLKANNYEIVGLETTEKGDNIFKHIFVRPTALVFGNEKNGISEETLKLCDKIITIPMNGFKNSLNVGVALGVALYEARRQWDFSVIE